MKRAMVIANGQHEGTREFFLPLLAQVDTLICADGGAEFAMRLGLIPDKIFGDLDSLNPELIKEYQKMGVQFVSFSVNKDKTDTHLVLDYLIREGFEEIILTGALGGRPDHLLGNLFLLNYCHQKGVKVKLISPTVQVQVGTGNMLIEGHRGDSFSLIPIDSVAGGVSLQGFKYPLKNHDVVRESTLGISNIIVADMARVTIKHGSAFCFIISQEIV